MTNYCKSYISVCLLSFLTQHFPSEIKLIELSGTVFGLSGFASQVLALQALCCAPWLEDKVLALPSWSEENF